ncbi:lysophospholipid acyltransferase family protein [Streptomyces sp. IB2014 016-6]|uniref:lysophospholipid acyltransferase family protein n=1 Tax=Streptomyces sp. IB2014 016-6 TaxID=2517818 RepID=UPI0011C90208|nr:lysophospholipid acyltransferase family protein [Streptomyces sp. IB2014 016-6]TXL85666.1 1-acyl-sn-glycerol-3-phosphate acyltransferase [Streptomyces sp. IB2014 016-6]
MSAWLPTAPCTPQLCGPRADALRRGTFAASARLLAGLVAVVVGILLVPPVALLGAGRRDRLTRGWTRTVIRAFGLRIRTGGESPAPMSGTPLPDVRVSGAPVSGTQVCAAPLPDTPGGVLVVANHISWLDIPLVATLFPGRVLAKSDIRRWPVLGAVAARGGTLFVERDRLRALPDAVRDVRDALRAGSRVIVFPEGSTWCGRDQGRFTAAMFQAALDAGVPVRPVRIGYRPLGPAAFVGDDPLALSLWRIVLARGLTAEIEVLPLIPAARHTDRRSLARAAQTAVASDSANRPASSVHQFVNSIPAPASSVRTRS